jgi:enoyl-CoA hydratase/carnithine racemase
VKVLFEKDSSVEGRRVFFREEFNLDYKVAQMPTIQISCWDGIVMGGGAGISAFAPIIIATEKTLFAMPEAKLGFFTDVGINYILARLRNHLGLYLGMTGARLKGEDVFVAGIAHFYIPSSKIAEARHEIFRVFDSKEKLNNPLETVRAILGKYHAPTGKTHLEHEDKIA